jgi:hypothetical protein
MPYPPNVCRLLAVVDGGHVEDLGSGPGAKSLGLTLRGWTNPGVGGGIFIPDGGWKLAGTGIGPPRPGTIVTGWWWRCGVA